MSRRIITYKAGPDKKAGVRSAEAAAAVRPEAASPRWVCARSSPRVRASTGTDPLPLQQHDETSVTESLSLRCVRTGLLFYLVVSLFSNNITREI